VPYPVKLRRTQYRSDGTIVYSETLDVSVTSAIAQEFYRHSDPPFRRNTLTRVTYEHDDGTAGAWCMPTGPVRPKLCNTAHYQT
jgi:hypothetical protein